MAGSERNEKKKILQNVAGYGNIKKSPKTWQVPEQYEKKQILSSQKRKEYKKIVIPQKRGRFQKNQK